MSGYLPIGAYRTQAGSRLVVSGKHGGVRHVDFDWLEEGGCLDCTVQPYEDDGYLVWDCEQCGGGRALLRRVEP
jgi:hypothetical protein